jgi:RNA polymerase sigma-70 factor (family 1)
MNTQPDDQIIAQFCTGDRKAYEVIYNHYYKDVFFIAWLFLRDKQMTMDIASEVFLRLWGQRKRFGKAGELRGWLIVASRNASLNKLRSRQRQEMMKKGVSFLTSTCLPSYEDQLIEVEVLRDLLKEVESLPPRCREVVDLLFFQGKKTKEVAVVLGISPSTVQSHKRNALVKLRAFRQRFIR